MPVEPSIPLEWHRQSVVDQSSPSMPVPPMFYQLMSAQFATITSILKDFQVNQENRFKFLEQHVDTKLQQLEVKLERKLTKFAYQIDSKLHQLDKNLTGQLTTIRKDHFYSDKRFRQLVESIKEIVTIAGQQISKLNDNFSL